MLMYRKVFLKFVVISSFVFLVACGSTETSDSNDTTFVVAASPNPVYASSDNYYNGVASVALSVYQGGVLAPVNGTITAKITSNANCFSSQSGASYDCFKLQNAAGTPLTNGGSTITAIFSNGKGQLFIGLGSAADPAVNHSTVVSSGTNFQFSLTVSSLTDGSTITSKTTSVTGQVQ